MRIESESTPTEEPRSVMFEFGRVKLTGLGTIWQFDYIPASPMLSGSFNNGRGIGASLPDPFALSHTAIAVPARLWRNAQPPALITLDRGGRAKLKINGR